MVIPRRLELLGGGGQHRGSAKLQGQRVQMLWAHQSPLVLLRDGGQGGSVLAWAELQI